MKYSSINICFYIIKGLLENAAQEYAKKFYSFMVLLPNATLPTLYLTTDHYACANIYQGTATDYTRNYGLGTHL